MARHGLPADALSGSHGYPPLATRPADGVSGNRRCRHRGWARPPRRGRQTIAGSTGCPNRCGPAPQEASWTASSLVHPRLPGHHRDVNRRRIIDDRLYAHFVTFGCDRRRTLLSLDQPKRIVLGVLNQELDRLQARCAGFVLMPDHVHAIVWFPEPGHLSRFMHEWKRVSSRRIREPLLPWLTPWATFWRPAGLPIVCERKCHPIARPGGAADHSPRRQPGDSGTPHHSPAPSGAAEWNDQFEVPVEYARGPHLL